MLRCISLSEFVVNTFDDAILRAQEQLDSERAIVERIELHVHTIGRSSRRTRGLIVYRPNAATTPMRLHRLTREGDDTPSISQQLDVLLTGEGRSRSLEAMAYAVGDSGGHGTAGAFHEEAIIVLRDLDQQGLDQHGAAVASEHRADTLATTMFESRSPSPLTPEG